MTCEELMKRDVKTTVEEETIQQAADKMARANVGFLPVCDSAGKVVGTVTDRDLAVRAVAKGKDPTSCRVGEVMSREIVACQASDDLAMAEQRMVQHHKSRVIVTDSAGALRGVISLSDLAVHEPGRRAAVVLREVASREVRQP